LIGTSIASAAARAGDAVVGWDLDPAIAQRAAARVGFRSASSPQDAVEGVGIVVVAAPVPAIASLVKLALMHAPDALVTDVGSVKAPVLAEIAGQGLPEGASTRYVPGHPMTGAERSGPDHASASLVDGAVWVLTPGPDTGEEAAARLASWIEGLGAVPVRMSPERHDRVVALVSHLPQIASTTLMGLAAAGEAEDPGSLLLAAGGFRDLTRLAASSPGLWSDILLSNRAAVLAVMDAYLERLGHLRAQIAGGDIAAIEATFAEAGRARRLLAAKPKVRSGVVVMQVPIPDRPGALALLTSSLAEGEVNIEDLQIVHAPQGDRGVVYLTVSEGLAEPALRTLSTHDFEPVLLGPGDAQR
jgi:prephenate dehydrogenase